MMVETIKKMRQSHEFISAMTGVDLAVVRQVLVQLKDPQLMQAKLRQAQQKSLKYGCAYSARLMRSPVQASNKKLYEQQVLEALLKDGQMTTEGSSLIAYELFREEIGHFSKETLELIEVCLIRKVDPETTLSLVSDCLSVLSPESDINFFLKVFEKVDNSQLPQLLELLYSKSSAELLQSLRLAEIEGLQLTVLAISKLFLSRVSLDFEVFLGCHKQSSSFK
jgi:hypothetical protein